jgi:hypothetical protein
VSFTPLEEKGLMADLPVKDNGLDAEAFGKSVDDAITEASKRNTSGGTVTGFGAGVGFQGDGTDDVSEADLDNAVGSAFGRTPVKGA